jgi:hypothetical protein
MPYKLSVIEPRILVRLRNGDEDKCSICGRQFKPFDRRLIKCNRYGRSNGNGRMPQRCEQCGQKAGLVEESFGSNIIRRLIAVPF